jgi:hypothetical protein
MGMFEAKAIPPMEVADLAIAYVAYVVLGNLSIKVNPVGFYQVTKALIAPTIVAINVATSGQLPRKDILASVAVLTIGILIATVTDDQVMSNMTGLMVGIASILSTAMYNIITGRKQKALCAGESSDLTSLWGIRQSHCHPLCAQPAHPAHACLPASETTPDDLHHSPVHTNHLTLPCTLL